MLENIINQLENLDIEQREYRQAVEAWQAADAYFMEVISQRESWTPAQLEKMREQAGINQALAMLATVTPPADDYDEDDLTDEEQTIDD